MTGLTTSPPELDAWAELASLYLGFGVLAANSTTVRRALPARVWGYALALFAWVRDETKPAWADYLRPDPLSSFRGGLRYLRRGGDSLFRLSTARLRYGAQSVNELTERLTQGPVCGRIAAMWELARKGSDAAGVVPLLVECLHARHVELRAEAANTLGRLGPVAAGTTEELIDVLRDPEPQVRAAAAGALGRMGLDAERVVPELAETLGDDQRSVVREVAESLRQFGLAAAPALPSMLEAFRTALVACDDSQASHLAASLQAIVTDAAACIANFLAEHDADLRHAALDILQQQGLLAEPTQESTRDS